MLCRSPSTFATFICHRENCFLPSRLARSPKAPSPAEAHAYRHAWAWERPPPLSGAAHLTPARAEAHKPMGNNFPGFPANKHLAWTPLCSERLETRLKHPAKRPVFVSALLTAFRAPRARRLTKMRKGGSATHPSPGRGSPGPSGRRRAKATVRDAGDGARGRAAPAGQPPPLAPSLPPPAPAPPPGRPLSYSDSKRICAAIAAARKESVASGRFVETDRNLGSPRLLGLGRNFIRRVTRPP